MHNNVDLLCNQLHNTNYMDSIALKEILIDQKKSLILELEKDPPLWRESQGLLEEMMSSKLVKIVMGIRRSGKSTLCVLNKDITHVAYVNFDDERLLSLKAKDLNQVYQVLLEINSPISVFIFDEIQNVHGWELFINRLQRKKLNILITGSNGKLLSHELATHLTGRHRSLELFPFSCREFFRFHRLSNEVLKTPSTEEKAKIYLLTEEYLRKGGFPEVLLGETSGSYLRELFNKIISRDILQRYSLKSSKALTELAIYLIQNSGGIITFHRLAKAFDFKSIHTLKAYFSYLQDTYLILEVLHFSNKTKERFTLPRKVYAIDTGMQRALSFKPDAEIGFSLETAVFLFLKRKYEEIYYIRSENHEVDFVICQNGKPKILIQSCWTLSDSKTKMREFSALAYHSTRLKVNELIIVTWETEASIKIDSKNIQIIPFWKFIL